MRNLATIQRITNISPIPGADKIEVAQVLGWQCVIAKADGFSVGDYVVYIEIDSILPDIPAFEFMRDRKFRVRTIKLRGQVSQGLIVPLSVLTRHSASWDEGQDVTDILGIKKYDPAALAEQKLLDEREKIEKNRLKKFAMRYTWYRRLFMPKKIGFPAFIRKTDEERIQNIPSVCSDFAFSPLVATEKLDGQSATYFVVKNPKWWQFWNPIIFGVCSRNVYLAKPDNSSYWKIARMYNIKDILVGIMKRYENKYVVIQGEIVGPGVQGNKYQLKDLDFYAFNLIVSGSSAAYRALVYHLVPGLKVVPLVDDTFLLKKTVQETVDLAKGQSVLNSNVHREGLVVRGQQNEISFKIINPDFLLKYYDE